LPVAHWGQTQHWGLFNHDNLPPWLSLPAEVLVIDFWVYAQHRVWHAIPILWRFHQIHHSDQEVDSGTSIRHHPVEALLTQTFYLALILVFGIAPIAVFTATAIALIHEIFAHANLSLPQKVDRMLRWLLVTPDMHRIHHSAESAESNRNFASIFPWWDRMCSTYLDAPAHGHTAMTLGLSYLRDSGQLSLWKLLSLPLQRPSVAPGRKATATENVPIPL
jgi:sterol desaturase/sphingolipid hydroxylase (fatty acid hydroxylase superfamily)